MRNSLSQRLSRLVRTPGEGEVAELRAGLPGVAMGGRVTNLPAEGECPGWQPRKGPSNSHLRGAKVWAGIAREEGVW